MSLLAYICSRCEQTFEFEAPKAPKTVACPLCGSAKTAKTKATGGTTGTYRYSESLGTVVRVSARVPGLTKSGGDSEPGLGSGPFPGCPPGGCGGCN
ncbi:MAG: hypothetical protein NTX64_15475 [Elusimicrobia bacterium]|nr:hypothetical protein [Elusimicrobiota bacterium]